MRFVQCVHLRSLVEVGAIAPVELPPALLCHPAEVALKVRDARQGAVVTELLGTIRARALGPLGSVHLAGIVQIAQGDCGRIVLSHHVLRCGCSRNQ